MATLFLSSNFLPLSSHKDWYWQWHSRQQPSRKLFSLTICASSSSNQSSSRSSRKVKSNQELYYDIREFLSTTGLPQYHVPSIVELSHHGRKDLANIVRRRGYKFIKQLLESSAETDLDGFYAEKSLAGQDQKVTDEVEDVSLSVHSEAESSTLNSPNENLNNTFEDIPADSSSNKNCHHDKSGDITENISSLSDVSITEYHSSSSNLNPSLNFDEHCYISLESSNTETDMETLEEEIVRYGDLDMIEDNANDILNESIDKESEGVVGLEDAIEQSRTPDLELGEQIFNDRIDRAMPLNGAALTSKQIASSATVNDSLSDDHLGTGLGGADFDSSEVEARRRENQVEINHLKFMLHQKEMELSQLKEQIEKEKIALSVLQTKAETEIDKAQKLVSDKDEELVVAEESLSGLEEVEIQYSGDGEIVEVAGSFNGWHHRIKMDPLPSSSITEPIESRKSRLWSTVLWLYPGTYEIKFIVDGQWKIDPQRDTVTKGGICNNIFRVNR